MTKTCTRDCLSCELARGDTEMSGVPLPGPLAIAGYVAVMFIALVLLAEWLTL